MRQLPLRGAKEGARGKIIIEQIFIRFIIFNSPFFPLLFLLGLYIPLLRSHILPFFTFPLFRAAIVYSFGYDDMTVFRHS